MFNKYKKAGFLLLAGVVLIFFAVAAQSHQSTLQSVEVVGTEFKVTTPDGRHLGSRDLIGHVLTIAGGDGKPVRIRIDSVIPDSADPEILFHRFSSQNASGEWVNICDPDPAGERKGFPMKGAMAADVSYHPEAPGFTLTCTGGVQAKCVRWGYKPWKQGPGGANMLELYNSCLRMARADYCGNGHGYTRNGMKIDLFDKFGIQRPEQANIMPFEAAWNVHGAVCLRHTRVPENGSVEDIFKACPRLRAAAQGEACNENTPGALLSNRSQ